MMSLSAIRQLSEEAAQKAAQEGQKPYVYFSADDVKPGFPFPFIGDYVPEGWEKVEEHFVDSSGLGADDEPALSVSQFVQLIRERIHASDVSVGWAITESGQFQVYVGEYIRTT